jgi:hypothetical protein
MVKRARRRYTEKCFCKFEVLQSIERKFYTYKVFFEQYTYKVLVFK